MKGYFKDALVNRGCNSVRSGVGTLSERFSRRLAGGEGGTAMLTRGRYSRCDISKKVEHCAIDRGEGERGWSRRSHSLADAPPPREGKGGCRRQPLSVTNWTVAAPQFRPSAS